MFELVPTKTAMQRLAVCDLVNAGAYLLRGEWKTAREQIEIALLWLERLEERQYREALQGEE